MEIPGEKLIVRMWDTLTEKGIGGLLRPGQMKREGLAGISVDRARMLIGAQTQREVEEIKSGRKNASDFPLELKFASIGNLSNAVSRIEPTLSVETVLEVCDSRVKNDALRHELNTSNAIIFAEEVLREDDSEPLSEKVDDDWLYRWRDYTGDVSNADLQMLWGRVLAGEVKAPGTYSLRCLDFIRNLSQSEAKLIESMCSLVVDIFIWRPNSYALPLSMSELLNLEELGLVSGVAGSLSLQYKHTEAPGAGWQKLLQSNGRCLYIQHKDESAILKVPAYAITKLGLQISKLGSFKPDYEYIEAMGRSFVAQGYKVIMADVAAVKDGYVTWRNEVSLA